MANLSKAILRFDIENGNLTGFDKLISRLESVVEEMPEELDRWLLDDATQMAKNLKLNYQEHIESLPRREQKGLHPETIYITKINGGYNVAINGPDIIYHEFGTGDQGQASNYPSKKALSYYGYVYNAGPKIIHAGEDLTDAPKWYVGMVTKHPETANNNWWMSPFGPSNGIPAGAFTYTTYQAFYDDLLSDKESSKWNIGKQSVHLKIRNKLTKGKWK